MNNTDTGAFLHNILSTVKTIAVVGASDKRVGLPMVYSAFTLSRAIRWSA